MENQNLQFKTNINCGGCVAAVKPHLDKTVGIGQWEVDIDNKEKILTVKSASSSVQEVMDTVQKAGFKIDLLNL
jgi:copper chaperone